MNEHIIVFQIQTRTATHVGSGKGNDVTDDLLRRSAAGQLLIPGSAIAGALRTIATRLAPRLYGEEEACQAIVGDPNPAGGEDGQGCRCPVCRLFGDVNPQPNQEQGGLASLLWIYDAQHVQSQILATAIRDGVGIHRTTRVAARQGSAKFDLEVLPAGTRFEIRLRLQTHPDATIQTQNEQLLALLLSEWQLGHGTVGGRVARGLGAFDLIGEIHWYHRHPQSIDTLMSFLRRQDDDFLAGTTLNKMDHAERLKKAKDALSVYPAPNTDPETDELAYATTRSYVEAEFTLQFTGPMLINDTAQSRRVGFDHAPVAATTISPNTWVLPGSGIRGVLRSQAEKIARTLTTYNAIDPANTTTPDAAKAYFLNHCPAGDPNVRDVAQPLANSDALLTAVGKLGDQDIMPIQLDLADRLFGSTRLGSRLRIEDGQLANRPMLKPMDFLAIDRFTGGGRDSAKFDAVALWQPAFTVRLRLENPQPWELGWLLLTLRDLHDDMNTIGFGAAKGFGVATISQWHVTIGAIAETDFPFAMPVSQLSVGSGGSTQGIWRTIACSNQDTKHQQTWQTLSQEWVAAFQQKILQFERDPSGANGVPPQETDSYFGKVESLYPVEVSPHGRPA